MKRNWTYYEATIGTAENVQVTVRADTLEELEKLVVETKPWYERFLYEYSTIGRKRIRRKKLIVSEGEAKLFNVLTDIVPRDRIYLKVRLADVFDIDDEQWAADEKDFMLKSHFDFLVTREDQTPVLAVEFDGPQHQTIEQRKRDERKTAMCRKDGLGLQRVTQNKFERIDILRNRLKSACDAWLRCF